MTADAIAAWAHFVSIFCAIAFLAAEIALYRPSLSADMLRSLRRLDAGYGLAAMAIIATGLLRVFHFGKGSDYYAHNAVFWLKMGLVAAAALLSALPTVHFRILSRDPASSVIAIEHDVYGRVRATLWAQAILFGLIPLVATLMARGVGLLG